MAFTTSGQQVFVQNLWTWFNVGGFAPGISLHLDGLSLLMMGMITGVGFLIHIFASWYMRGEEGYARFFSYFNLFVASMLLLVLGDNLALLFLGWEGVGLCSYLLIGFYYSNPANGWAAIKAFTVTRVGDVFLLIALFLLYQQFGTLNTQYIVEHAATVMTQSSSLSIWTALFPATYSAPAIRFAPRLPLMTGIGIISPMLCQSSKSSMLQQPSLW